MIGFSRVLYTTPPLPLLWFWLCFRGFTVLLRLSFFLYIFGFFPFWQITGKFKRGKVVVWLAPGSHATREAGGEPNSPGISGCYLAQKEKRSEALTNAKENRVLKVQSLVILLKLETLVAHIKDVLMSSVICWFMFIWLSAEMIAKWLKMNL